MPRLCQQCNNEIGSEKIHLNLHLLFLAHPKLVQTGSNNEIIWLYWYNYDALMDRLYAFVNTAKPIQYNELTSLQALDREIRNILQPSKTRAKSRKMQQQYRDHYATPPTS